VQEPLQFFKMYNPHAVEKSLWGANDEIITFCVEVSDKAIIKSDIGAIDFLKKVKSTYENWVIPGTNDPDSSPGLTHNVSNTVHVAEDEWDNVSDFIFKNRGCFSGVALLPKAADKFYKQAPNESIISEDDIMKWNELISKFEIIDWTRLQECDDNTALRETVACAGGACSV